MIIIIPNYRAKSRNKTITSHWRNYSNARDEVVGYVKKYSSKIEVIEPAAVTIEAYYRGKIAVDTSNIDDKLFIDALQVIGVLTNDTPLQNPVVIKKAYLATGEDKVIIRVEKCT